MFLNSIVKLLIYSLPNLLFFPAFCYMYVLQSMLLHSVHVTLLLSCVMDRYQSMLLYGVRVVYRNLSSSDLLLCTYPLTHHYPQKLERRTALLPLFDVTGKMKLPAVKDYILDMLEGGRKIIVFGHHVSVLNGLCEALDKKVGISVCTGTCEKELLTQHFILRTIPNLNISLGALRTYVDTNTHTHMYTHTNG